MGKWKNLYLTRLLFYDILKGGLCENSAPDARGGADEKKNRSRIISTFVLGVALVVLLGTESMRLAIGMKPHSKFLRGHLAVGLLIASHFLLLTHRSSLLTMIL